MSEGIHAYLVTDSDQPVFYMGKSSPGETVTIQEPVIIPLSEVVSMQNHRHISYLRGVYSGTSHHLPEPRTFKKADIQKHYTLERKL